MIDDFVETCSFKGVQALPLAPFMIMGPLPSGDLLKEIVLDTSREVPLHAQLRTSLRRLIIESFEDTSRFFSEAQLIDHLRVSQGTVRRALTDLAADGILEKRPAKGTIVRKNNRNLGMRNLAIFLPEYFSSNITEILTRINLECLNRRITPQVIFTHRGEKLQRAYNQLQFQPKEGAVVLLANSPLATAELTTALTEREYECISVDTQLRDVEQKFVGVDNRIGIDLGMDHLTGLGHRAIALLVNEPEASKNIQERIAAFEAYGPSRKLSLQTQVFHTGVDVWESSTTAALTAMEAIWTAKPRPTAIFAVSDSGAIASVQWLQKRNIKVPEEISVLGFDGSDFGAMIHPALTTIANPFQAFSDAVFAILDQKLISPPPRFLPPFLVVRESTIALT
jgi:LacI family transcriptional regulator